MKCLLLPLLSALTLPTANNGESVSLWLRATNSSGGASQEKILMKSIEQCKSEGKKWVIAGGETSQRRGWRSFHCFIGK